jgi:hypothetical protein
MAAKKSRPARRALKNATKKAKAPERKREEGPLGWLLPNRESSYSKLIPKAQAQAERVAAAQKFAGLSTRRSKPEKGKAKEFKSTYQPGRGEDVLAKVPRDYWLKHMQTFQQRKANSPRRGPGPRPGSGPGSPVVPGTNNWIPLGPSVQARGSALGRPAVSGRTPGIAIAPGGMRMYVATACGGVWRSDNGGAAWRSTMDGFDQTTTSFGSTCLACGAIAIDPNDPDRVYVGTGEGDTDSIFAARLVNALPCYRGVGPIRSDNGGGTWNPEPSNPSLAGYSFYQIAVDPADRDHCVAATSNGLYERIPIGGGNYQWQQRRTGSHSSVVVTSTGGVTQWFAGAWGDQVYTSMDGTNWTAIGTGFPTGITRIALGVQADNPNVLYAATSASGPLGNVVRLDGAAGAWNNISGLPGLCPGGQADYDLAIAVDPNNANLIYLGGDYYDDESEAYPGSIFCCVISFSGGSYSMATTAIGTTAHADDHVLMFTPGDSNALWVGCDGGLFLNTSPSTGGAFSPMNTGLATLCTSHFTQHPTEPAVMFTGLQDNGTAKYVGEEVWTEVEMSDGGYGIVNWNNPFNVMCYWDGSLYTATDGGIDFSSWTFVNSGGSTMEAPVVSAPYNPGSPADANIVAFGIYGGVQISPTFGASWPDTVMFPDSTTQPYSMVGASATRFFVGTSSGEVFRLDNTGGTWGLTRIDNVAAGALPLAGLVSDIEVDWSDPTLSSVYICFGGTSGADDANLGDYRHVWHFNGTSWSNASGTSGSSTALLDIEHNAIQFDNVSGNLYVGADLGVWESTDAGATWNPMANGLPDAAVFDLQLHPTLRLLRACLHGRGLWEWKLDAPIQPDVELLIRDTLLDVGTDVDDDGRPDPSVAPGSTVVHYESPNIKVDAPTTAGYQTPGTSIDFLTFNEVIIDGSQGVETNSPPPTVHNRVYAEIHNRGPVDAASVQVMALLTNASAGLPLLPSGYTTNVVNGTPISTPDWTTLGFVTLSALHNSFPQIAYFDLPSTVLPMPASLPGQSHYCLLMLLHSTQDPFTNTQQNVDALTLSDRKVGQKNMHIVAFSGTPPMGPSAGHGMWAMLGLNGGFFKERGLFDLVIDASQFPGTLSIVLPPGIFPKDVKRQAEPFRPGSAAMVKSWIKQHGPVAKRLFHEAKYPLAQYRRLVDAMEKVESQKPLVLAGGRRALIRSLPIARHDSYTMFLRIDPPPKARVGDQWTFDVTQTDAATGKLMGGSRYKVVINKKA